mmetsp:Transcript_27593/g.40607  ORF Transcript_27593/g.40607 Transcript_27593/m.40607 type:complete len:185 (+) Transcript_27593:1602-2156(+)
MTERPLSGIPSQEEINAMDSVYEEIISSICIDLAFGMHKLVKTGIIPYSDVMIPRDFDSDLDGEEEGGGGGRRRKKRKLPSSNLVTMEYPRSTINAWSDDDKSVIGGTAAADEVVIAPPPVTRGSQMDVWGRAPPKDPGNTLCTVCGRQVNTLRFAPHLDKCMGIGTLRGGYGNGGTGTRSSTR